MLLYLTRLSLKLDIIQLICDLMCIVFFQLSIVNEHLNIVLRPDVIVLNRKKIFENYTIDM